VECIWNMSAYVMRQRGAARSWRVERETPRVELRFGRRVIIAMRSAARAVGFPLWIVLLASVLAIAPLGAQTSPSEPGATPADTAPTGFVGEPSFLSKGITAVHRLGGGETNEAKNGFYPEFGNMITGAGWISAGPGYRQRLLDKRVLVDASAAYSWRGYKATQARVELPRLAGDRLVAGAQYRWQDMVQVSYFGQGPDSRPDDRSEYRLRSHNIVGYAAYSPTEWLTVGARGGWLHSPDILPPDGHFQRELPSVQDTFPNDPAIARQAQPDYLHAEVSVVSDTRDHRGHPLHGGLYRAAGAAFSDRESGAFSFRRYEFEAAHYVPLSSDRIVLAFHGWTVLTGTDDASVVPFYLLPSLGGGNTLRGFDDYRFHDRNLLVVNAEAHLAIFTHVEGVLFVDAGTVAPRAADLGLRHRSYGMGVRVHSRDATLASFDVGASREGWRFLFQVHEPLNFSRLLRRTAGIPFVP
jgi:hypothetical protein